MSWANWTLTLLLLIPALASGQEEKESSGWEMLEAGNYETALDTLADATSASAHVIRAAAYNSLEEFDLATSEAWQAVESRSIDQALLPEAYNQLGLSRLIPVLQEIHTLTDIDGAVASLIDAEDSFWAAHEESGQMETADGIYLNLACALVAQMMIDRHWNHLGKLENVLGTVSRLMPERKEWAEAVLAGDPSIPDEISSFTHSEIIKRPYYSRPQIQCDPQQTIYHLDTEALIGPRRRTTVPQPQYTEAARKARIEGTVVVQVVVDASGIPTCLKVVESLDPGLDEQALNAFRQWRFDPASLNGAPVPVYYNLTVSFRLQ